MPRPNTSRPALLNAMPAYGCRGHDVEAFRAEVARYGAWTADLADFAATLREHA